MSLTSARTVSNSWFLFHLPAHIDYVIEGKRLQNLEVQRIFHRVSLDVPPAGLKPSATITKPTCAGFLDLQKLIGIG